MSKRSVCTHDTEPGAQTLKGRCRPCLVENRRAAAIAREERRERDAQALSEVSCVTVVIPPTPELRGRLFPAARRACPFCAREVAVYEHEVAPGAWRDRVLCVEHGALSGWVVTQRCSKDGLWVTAEARSASDHAVMYDAEFNDDRSQNPEPIAWANWIEQDLSRFKVSGKSWALDKALRKEERALYAQMSEARRARAAKLEAKRRRGTDERNAEQRAWLAGAPGREARRAAERKRAEQQKRASLGRKEERKPRAVWVHDREDSFAA